MEVVVLLHRALLQFVGNDVTAFNDVRECVFGPTAIWSDSGLAPAFVVQ